MEEQKTTNQKRKRVRKTIFQKLRERVSQFGTLNIVLVFIFVLFLWFNKQMLEIYKLQGSIPEGYACAVIGALLGECGVCGWIKNSKERNREHKWEQENRQK